MNNNVSDKNVSTAYEEFVNDLQRGQMNAVWEKVCRRLQNKYSPDRLATSSVLSDPKFVQYLSKCKHAKGWVVESSRAMLSCLDGKLKLLMVFEEDSWRFAGIIREAAPLPEKSPGFSVDKQCLRLYPKNIQETLQEIVAFYKHAQEAMGSGQPKTIANLFFSYCNLSERRLSQVSIIQFYLNHAKEEASRAIDSVRICKDEAVLDFNGTSLIWCLRRAAGLWRIVKILDLSAVDLKLSQCPSYYFVRTATGLQTP